MSSKILLLSTNRYTSPDPVFPLGLACINGALVGAGHQTECIDANLDSMDDIERVIAQFEPDFFRFFP